MAVLGESRSFMRRIYDLGPGSEVPKEIRAPRHVGQEGVLLSKVDVNGESYAQGLKIWTNVAGRSGLDDATRKSE